MNTVHGSQLTVHGNARIYSEPLYITNNTVVLTQFIMAFNFEKLKVWQASVDMSADIYEMTKKFPKDEMFGLTSQIRRAVDSVSLNIAEGSTGQSKTEFKRFLGYSVRSGIEVVACLHLARRKEFIEQSEFSEFYNKTERLIISIQSLRKTLA